MRYFKAPQQLAYAVRLQVMQALGHPNGRAEEPWKPDGDFVKDGYVYLGLGPIHTEGPFWEPMIQQAIDAGVTEITREQYMADRPQVEIEF